MNRVGGGLAVAGGSGVHGVGSWEWAPVRVVMERRRRGRWLVRRVWGGGWRVGAVGSGGTGRVEPLVSVSVLGSGIHLRHAPVCRGR